MKRTGLLLAVLAVVLVTAGWYMLVMKPIGETVADKQTQLQDAQDQELTLRTRLARLQKIQDAELSYISAIGALDEQIPAKPEMPSLIDDLDALADKTSVEWLGASYGEPTLVPDTDYYAIAVSLRIKGQFFEILGYLYGINDLERLVRIDGVTVSPGEEDGYTVLGVTITAVAFTTSPLTVPVGDTTTTTEPDTTTSTTQPETTTTTEADAGSTTTTSSTTTTTTGGG